MEILRENRDKGDGQRSFGKETPQEVRDPKGHKKSVRSHAGPEKAGNNHIPYKSQDTTQKREETDNACSIVRYLGAKK